VASCLSLSLACGDKDGETGETSTVSGADLYSSKCVVCHGADGDGNSAVLADAVPAMSDAELEDVIENGNDAGMPAQTSDAAEISALVDYLRETWGG